MPKRDRSNPEDEDDEGTIDAKRVDANPDGKDGSESESDSDMEVIDMEDSCGVQFVAWLEEGATCLSIGEIHFSSADQTEIGDDDGDGDEKEKDNHNEKDNQKDTDPNAYCVVCQLHLLPPETDAEEEEKDEEAPLVYTFDGGFPFKVLPVVACVPVHLDPVLSDAEADAMVEKEDENEDNGNGDGDASLSMIFRTFALEAAVHQGILEELNSSSNSSNSNSNSNNNNNNKDDDGKEHDDDPYEKVSPDWKFTSPATDQQVVDGVRAWCKAGEDKTGWDLSKIPKTCHTTREVLVGNGGKDENEDEDHKDDDGNVLLRLYRDLCARELAVDADREAIEDRFEWRTSLCTYFAWAVPNAKAIRTLVDLKQPILEVGAGTGYWAWLLSQKGVDVAAYDLADSQGGQKHRFRHSIVKDGSVEQVSAPEHSNRILLVCWPDIVGDSAQDDADRGSFGAETLKTYQGDTVVHIGELESTGVAAAANGWGNPFPPGGSSTSAAFQKELVDCFELKETVHLPNWPPYNSHMTVWARKK